MVKKEDIDKTKWAHLPKHKKWFEKRKLKLRAVGISNWVKDSNDGKRYSVQFYDLDTEGLDKKEIRLRIKKVMTIFPYDCILYQTKHGLHFISFSLLKGWRVCKARAIELSKRMGDQDYWTTSRSLVLRISPKWRLYHISKLRYTISERPKFLGFLKRPNKYRISKNHLEFYFKNMNLPFWVYEAYNDCDKKDYQISITHYRTRD